MFPIIDKNKYREDQKLDDVIHQRPHNTVLSEHKEAPIRTQVSTGREELKSSMSYKLAELRTKNIYEKFPNVWTMKDIYLYTWAKEKSHKGY